MRSDKIQQLLGRLTPKGATGEGGTALVARQPIFDSAGKIWAYELLFRDPSMKPGLGEKSAHAATSTVMMDGFELMRPSLREGQRFFINFTAELLETELAGTLPPNICVIEILETVEATPSVLKGLTNLKKQGYMLALDDYVGQPELAEFLPLADIIKVEVLGRTPAQLRSLARGLHRHNAKLLAEKVEDNETATLCRELDFSLFQGYFYSKAEVIKGKKLAPSQITKARLLSLSLQEEDNFPEVAAAISADVYLTYKLLKYVNSVYFGLAMQVRSVEHAIMLLGRLKLQQWLCVTALAEMDSAPMAREIVYISALRAKFLELLALHKYPVLVNGKNIPATLFLMGLFSLLEGVLKMPMEEIFATLPMDDEVVDALVGRAGPYTLWMKLIEAYERGEWETTRCIAASLNLSYFDLAEAYAEASNWSTALFGSL